MRVAVVASSGGSVFAHLREILSARDAAANEYFVVTDRPCGIESYCQKNNVACQRIEEPDNVHFSQRAGDWLGEQGGVDFVLLFFLRLVTPELFTRFPTFNIHPSLLPAFRGFGPLAKALDARARFVGATLHLVNAQADAGAIVAQVCMPLLGNETVEKLEKYSFIQKVYLALVLVDLLERECLSVAADRGDARVRPGLPATDRCNPRLADEFCHQAVLRLQQQEQVEVIR